MTGLINEVMEKKGGNLRDNEVENNERSELGETKCLVSQRKVWNERSEWAFSECILFVDS